MITEATLYTGTLTSSGTKVTGSSTTFGQYPNDTNGYEPLRPGDLIFVVKSGVGETREVDLVDDRQQIFYLKDAFASNLTGQNFYRIPREFGEGVKFPLFTLASNYSLSFPCPQRISLNVQAALGSLTASDGVLKIQTMNDPAATPTDVTDATYTAASSDTNATINMDGFTVGKWINVVFTRNSNTTGAIQVTLFFNRNLP